MKPTLSVIIPNYNHARFLPASLGAILSQSRSADEIIIIDDASQDESVFLIESLIEKHPQIRLFHNKTNQGPLKTVAKALSLATGDYLAFCSADDKVLPSFFKTGMNYLEQCPNVGLFCSKGCFFLDSTPDIFEEEKNWIDLAEPKMFSPKETISLLRSTNFRISTPSSLYKRSSVLKMGGYQQGAKMLSDWLLSCQIALEEGFIYVPQTFSATRVLPQTQSYSAKIYEDRKKREEVYTYLLGFLKEHPMQQVYAKALIVYQLGWDFLPYLFKHPRYWSYLPSIAWKKLKLTCKRL